VTDDFKHTFGCHFLEHGNMCDCGADRAKAAWNAAVESFRKQLIMRYGHYAAGSAIAKELKRE
jgi:hypothetical protein